MANEKRLIDANALEELENLACVCDPVRDGCEWYRAADVWACIEREPTVDAVEVKHGRWKYYHKQNKAVCTNCSFERDLDVNFGRAISCPNCGAKMDGDGNG